MCCFYVILHSFYIISVLIYIYNRRTVAGEGNKFDWTVFRRIIRLIVYYCSSIQFMWLSKSDVDNVGASWAWWKTERPLKPEYGRGPRIFMRLRSIHLGAPLLKPVAPLNVAAITRKSVGLLCARASCSCGNETDRLTWILQQLVRCFRKPHALGPIKGPGNELMQRIISACWKELTPEPLYWDHLNSNIARQVMALLLNVIWCSFYGVVNWW